MEKALDVLQAMNSLQTLLHVLLTITEHFSVINVEVNYKVMNP